MKAKLATLFRGASLTRAQAEEAMTLMMSESTPPEQTAAALGALRAKGESFAELAGFVAAVRARAISVPCRRTDLMDNCGTGGDGAGTFNISTATSFVLAAGGLGVAKHGNRSVSSRCGSADVLEALGIAVDLSPAAAGRALDLLGFAFLFSVRFHPGLARVASVRRSIGVPTIFNVLGPLVNPAAVTHQLVGVYDAKLAETMALVLGDRGVREAMVVTGEGGLDELTLHGPSAVVHLKEGKVTRTTISPEDAGLARAPLSALRGGSDAAESAAILDAVFAGERGPRRDVVCLNAAAAFLICGKASSLGEGASLAGRLLDDGSVRARVAALRDFR